MCCTDDIGISYDSLPGWGAVKSKVEMTRGPAARNPVAKGQCGIILGYTSRATEQDSEVTDGGCCRACMVYYFLRE